MDIPIYLELEEDENMSGFNNNNKTARDPLLPGTFGNGKLILLHFKEL